MERSGASCQGCERGTQSKGPGTARLTATFLTAILGSFAGVMLWVLISVITPFWLFLSLPQMLGALFASSAAYLFAGSARTALSRTMALSLIAGAGCGVANILLYTGMVPGIGALSDLTPREGRRRFRWKLCLLAQ